MGVNLDISCRPPVIMKYLGLFLLFCFSSSILGQDDDYYDYDYYDCEDEDYANDYPEYCDPNFCEDNPDDDYPEYCDEDGGSSEPDYELDCDCSDITLKDGN